MAKDTLHMPHNTAGRHGRLHEEEAAREKGHTFSEPQPDTRKADAEAKAHADRIAAKQAAVAEPVVPAPEPAVTPKPGVTMNIADDLYGVFCVKYPGFDIRIIRDTDNNLKIAVPGGFIIADRARVEAITNRNDLRAYVDSLKVQ